MKDFPMRGTELNKIEVDMNELIDTCQCGHAWHDHVLPHKGQPECEICTCPEYVFERKITRSAYRELKKYLKKTSGVFTT